MTKLSFVIILVSFLITLIYGQNFTIQFGHVSVRDGLSGNYVTSILQDKQGFMWFGTDNGLNRYDGYNFSTYFNVLGDSNSISDNTIFSICEDGIGNLWIGTSNGLNLFDRTTEKFYCYRYNPKDFNSLPHNSVYSIITDIDGNLWIGTADGLAFLSDSVLTNITHNNNPQFKIYKHKPNNSKSISSNNIKYIFEDRLGSIWISTWCDGINRFDKQKKIFRHYKGNDNLYKSLWKTKRYKDLPSRCINTIYQESGDEDIIIWLGSNNELIKFDIKQEIFTAYYPKPKNPLSKSRINILSIHKTSNALFVLGTNGFGLNIFDKNEERFYKLKKESNNPNSISSNIILTICEDNSGVIWLGTAGGGINKFDTKSKNFYQYLSSSGYKNNLTNISVESIFEDLDDGYLWIGTGCEGLIRYDPDTGNHTQFNIDSLINPFRAKRACYPIVSIHQNINNKGDIWLGIAGQGLVKYNKIKKEFISYNFVSPLSEFAKRGRKNISLFSTVHITHIVFDNKQNLWLATLFGLYKYNPKLDTFRSFKHDPNNINSISQDNLTCLLFDKYSELWIGTTGNGLDRYNPETNQFAHFKSDPSNLKTISNNFIRCLYQDKNDILWIGTSMGLNKYDGKKNTFKRFYKKDGLPSNRIQGFLEDNNGNLWISTDKGLSKYNFSDFNFRNYDIYDGLQGIEFNLNACFKNEEGELFFGGPNGLNSFYPDSIKDNINIPPIVLTNFQLFNKTIKPEKNSPLKTTISEAKEIILKYDQSVFSIEFAALNYSAPMKNKYAYRMEGIDPDWVYTNASRRFATYTNLDPGVYTFRVKGSNNDGIWNEEGASVKIIILPPWWATWWAYTIYFILVSSFLYGFFRFETNRKEMQHRAVVAELQAKTAEAQKEAEKEQMRSRIASDLHDEIGGNLSSIAMIGQALEKRLKLPGHEKERLRKIPHIARITAESMRDIVWFVNPANDSFEKLLAKMRETANLMLEGMEVDFNFEVDKANFNNDLNFRRNLFLLYKEILQNIVRHAKATQVTIKFDQNEKQFTLSVKDNGIGFNTKTEFKGNGLKNFKRRAEEMNGEIVVSSEPDMGTRVKLSVKIP